MAIPATPRVPSNLRGQRSEQSKNLIQAFVDSIPVKSWDDHSESVMGSGRFTYRMVNDWAKLPDGWDFDDVASVAVDAKDRVYVFCRGEHPVIVFDRDGNFIASWGEDFIKHAHSVTIGPDGMVYLTDDGDHCVRKCTPEGKLLLTIGTPGEPAPFMSGDPFCRCTDVAIGPQGAIYVSDGYYNARVHKYAPDGTLVKSWGGPGTDPGQFNVAHNITVDEEGWIYVADRENHRVQVFDGEGKYETQWNNIHRASSLAHDPKTPEKLFYLGELGPHLTANRHMPNCGPRVTILSKEGQALARLGTLPAGNAPDRFISPHGISVDSRGDIYVGEVSYSSGGGLFVGTPDAPVLLRTLRKLVKTS